MLRVTPSSFFKPMLTTSDERNAWAEQLYCLEGDEAFDLMAKELFAFQYKQCEPLRRLAEAKGVHPSTIKSWREIPAVPQRVFKATSLYCHGALDGPHQPKSIFHTSGTTTGVPGKQYLLATDLYEKTVVEGACRAGLFSQKKQELHFLAPPRRQAPHSSLSAMWEKWAATWGTEATTFWVREEKLKLQGFRQRLALAILENRPVGLCGAAFAWIHYLDAYAQEDPLRLPSGSWILETGGFKGKSREMAKEEFYQALAYLLGVPTQAIWNEYGMTELSSQAYASGPQGIHQVPPWARVLIIHPETEEEVAVGEIGLVRWIDLANVDSVLAVQTLDQAVRSEQGGFYLLGRLAGTEARGCSLTAETFRPEIGP